MAPVVVVPVVDVLEPTTIAMMMMIGLVRSNDGHEESQSLYDSEMHRLLVVQQELLLYVVVVVLLLLGTGPLPPTPQTAASCWCVMMWNVRVSVTTFLFGTSNCFRQIVCSTYSIEYSNCIQYIIK